MKTAHSHRSLVAGLVVATCVMTVGLVRPLLAAAQTPASATTTTTAPEQTTLTAIPPRLGDDFALKAKPGEKIQTTIRIRNSSSKSLPIHTLVQDFIIGEDGETPQPVTDATSNRWSLASWITISPENQVLQPGQTASVNVLVTVPADALPGGHYAMVLHEPSSGLPSGAGSESVIAQRVGTLVYFLVEGPINEEAFIRNFKFADFTEYGPVDYAFSVENMSDIHVKPSITVDIYNIFGQKVDSLTVEPKNVFPLMARNYTGQWNRVWGIGFYTAKLTMSFGTQGQIVVANDQFWLIPYKLVLAGFVILVSLIGAAVAVRRHMIHRRSNEGARIQELEQKLQQLESEKTNPPPTPIE